MTELKKEIRNDGVAVKIMVVENGAVLGWAILHIITNDRHDEPYALLENLYVEKEYRSRGIGTELVEAAIVEARQRGCYKMIGTSRYERNLLVEKFYKKFGFKDWGKEFRLDLKDSKPKQRD